ncbi:LLM class F420-dependent oxidoreductase [Mycolicibacterium pulveris]|uniref:LLM class F420-dependent oxidoreductase n=1 Tax=Mycolicibacterium pulveris TaxID=36813 RepID=A0A7I7ULF9_MYCPV|nr:LLM class F420-dependent oxidoreductase [Mycolicibacterium pulveris]MCV6980122.1 LLM class F420-dependent oxidoreductase [Mycolicibacterium pulveris]BBY81499.1 LLM class F420-dependent oxidoreductase [Mycolicibacterium pulveris]
MTTSSETSFRFGVTMTTPSGREAWISKCRKAEEYGYDVIGVADHLGKPAPFPAVVLAAAATERVRVCTFVLNTSFYNPVLLARDVATTDQLTDGRLDLGLGTGYVKAEFAAAGLAFSGPSKRLNHLEATISGLRTCFANAEPRPVQQPGPPLLLGGERDRMLTLAAREADIVGLVGMTSTPEGRLARIATPSELKERVDFVRTHAGERMDRIELNLLVQKVIVTNDRKGAFEQLLPHTPGNMIDELAEAPILLVGSVEQIADQVLGLREQFGFSYIMVLEPEMDDFAAVIERLR